MQQQAPIDEIQRLLDGFDPSEVQRIAADHLAEIQSIGTTVALRRRHAIKTRRIESQDVLSAAVPAVIAPGESVHCMSQGDVDVLSYTAHFLAAAGHFDHVLMATWRINRDDLELIASWVDAGRIARFDLVIDQRFARLSPDEHSLALQICNASDGEVLLLLNHSKVTLLENDDTALVIESSANVNTNHRLEQTTICHDRALLAWYRDIYREHRSRRRTG